MTQNSKTVTEKIDIFNNVNTNKFCMAGKKLALRKAKRQMTKTQKVFAIYITDKGLYPLPKMSL